MIRFSCLPWGMAVSAPEDCVGRCTKCRSCPLTVEKTTPFWALTLLALVVFSSANAQETKSDTKKQKVEKKDDLPDVSLVVPEDTSPELKATLKSNALALGSKRPTERLRAAQTLGELGEKGKPVRGLLCRTMLLDPVPDVRVAAADALKNIDSKIHYLAVALLKEKSSFGLIGLLARIQKLEEDGEPLAPLVAYGVIVASRNRNPPLISAYLTALSHIARNDLAACKLVASALTNKDTTVRYTAVRELARMKHGKLAVPQIIALLKIDISANRIAAIATLTALSDESTEEVIAAAITAQRYHDDAAVRRAVEVALNKLENKKQKP